MSALVAARSKRQLGPYQILSTLGSGREIVPFRKKQTIFAQGDRSDAIFYVHDGKVRLTVVAKNGKQATIALLGEGDFFGEGCLAEQPFRVCFAAALTDCSVMRIDKQAMVDLLRQEQAFSQMFLSYLLKRNMRYEEDLLDQFFNSSEKRLARILLLLSGFGKDEDAEVALPRLSQETLAQMVGTTRSRVNFFMNRFRKLGFVDYYNDGLRVHPSLLRGVLRE
jgi:CRP/FNR family transcriptional regulator, cyclic AMP receptor protein